MSLSLNPLSILKKLCYTIWPACIHLFNNPLEQVVEPNNLYTASGELFFTGVGFAWIITLAAEPEYIANNELKRRIGYNNVCVGFDMPPASYVAMPVLAISVTMGIVYVWMDTQRGLLQRAAGEINNRQFLFTYWSNMCFAISLSLIPLIMVMTPEVNTWGHLMLFIQHIVMRMAITSANFYEAHDLPKKSLIWFWSCLFVTTVYPALLIIDFIYFDYEESIGVDAEALGPIIPWWVTMFFDLAWFAFLGTTSLFLPPAPHLRIKYSLVTDEELEELHNRTKVNWKKARLLNTIARQRGQTLETLKKATADGVVNLLDSKSLDAAAKMDLVASEALAMEKSNRL